MQLFNSRRSASIIDRDGYFGEIKDPFGGPPKLLMIEFIQGWRIAQWVRVSTEEVIVIVYEVVIHSAFDVSRNGYKVWHPKAIKVLRVAVCSRDGRLGTSEHF